MRFLFEREKVWLGLEQIFFEGEKYLDIIEKNYISFDGFDINDVVSVEKEGDEVFIGKIVDIEERSGTIGFVIKNIYDLNRWWFSVEEYKLKKWGFYYEYN